MAKLEIKISHNSKDERKIYGKMFFKNERSQSSHKESITDYVEKNKVVIAPVKTSIEREIEQELAKIDSEVHQLISKKKEEMSFEIKEGADALKMPEIDQLQDIIETQIMNIGLCKKLGKFEEYDLLRGKIKEMKFAKEHLLLTLNLDFKRPTMKMKSFAEKSNIDLDDPKVHEEFEIMQLQNLEDIRRIRDGKP